MGMGTGMGTFGMGMGTFGMGMGTFGMGMGAMSSMMSGMLGSSGKACLNQLSMLSEILPKEGLVFLAHSWLEFVLGPAVTIRNKNATNQLKKRGSATSGCGRFCSATTTFPTELRTLPPPPPRIALSLRPRLRL